ncbi:MAG TPA: site-specific integrase [Xanthobacteraceae bacterium]|nr:site-specific integrase [Xanthobacteraceae bacterium]
MVSTEYLKQRGHIWYVRVQIPPHLWKAAGGRREYVKTLKTGDLAEANKRKHPIVAAFKQQIAALEKPQAARAALSDLYDKAIAWRDAMERHKGVVLYEEADGEPYFITDEYLSQISEEAKEFIEQYGEKAANAFYKIAKGEGTLLNAQVDNWLIEQAGLITAQTIAHHRTAVNAFLTWAGDDTLIEEVSRKKAGEFVSHLLSHASGLGRRTAGRYVSSLSSFWNWLEARGLAQANPWLRHGVNKKPKRGVEKKRSQWTDDALVKVLTGTYTSRYSEVFHDLVKLALVTGARLDELCALKVGDVQKREDGWWITIREGKSEAAVRDVPLHDSAVHIITRRLKHSKTYIFEGLLPGGPDHKRSWHVSKAFGRYTKSLELGEKRQTFHDLRATFIEVLEGAEVPESTVKLIVGHARQSMTYGNYSKGKRVDLREAIKKLRYSSVLMKLISTDDTSDDRTSGGRRQAGTATTAKKRRGS